MTRENKKGNVFTNNPLVKAIGSQKMVVLMAVIVLFVVFSIASGSFRQYTTMLSLLDMIYYIAFMAMGVTFCLITGGVDCGLLMGIFNGFLVAVMNLPPFIATLCSMMITRGLGSLVTGGLSVAWPASSTPEGAFRNLFKLNVGGTIIPVGLIFVLAAAVLMSIFLNKTRPGRYIIAVGSNKEALRLSGVNVVKWQWLAYVISGIFTGLAAVAYAGVLSSSVAPGGGAGLEMDAICGAIIGGTSMNGGAGTISGSSQDLY